MTSLSIAGIRDGLRANRQALRELAGFIMVGGSGAVAFIVLSTVLIGLKTGLPDWIVSVLIWIGLIVPVYLGHHRFSFRTGVAHRQGLPRYAATQMAAVVVAALISYVVYSLAHLSPLVGSVLVSGLTAVMSFFVLKLWAFAAPHA